MDLLVAGLLPRPSTPGRHFFCFSILPRMIGRSDDLSGRFQALLEENGRLHSDLPEQTLRKPPKTILESNHRGSRA